MAPHLRIPCGSYGVVMACMSLTGLVLGGQPGWTQPLIPLPADPTAPLSLQVPDLELEPILSQEILTPAVGRSGFRTGLSLTTNSTSTDPEQARALLEAGLGGLGPLNPYIVRILPTAWQTWLPADWSLNTVNVSYRLQGLSGQPQVLTHAEDTRARIHVHLEPLPPTAVSRAVVTRQVGEAPLYLQQVSGGLRLELDLREASKAGRYEGILEITLSQL